MEHTRFIGLDIHKERISVAVAESGRSGAVEYLGEIANEPGAISKLCDRLRRPGKPQAFCYEAGPCGYGVHRRPCLGTVSIETVDCATLMPSFARRGFSILILRIRSRTSLPIRGRPPRGRDFHRKYAAKPIRCQRTTVSGLTMVTASRMRGQRR
jgi:hypothetical protein